MKFEVGINANPTNGFTPQDVNGLYYVRFPMWIVQNRYFDYGPFLNGVRDQGMWSQVCFDSRTFPDSDYEGTLRRIRDKYPQINWIQTGQNEFDNKSESSSYATSARVDKIITATRKVFGDNIWLTAPAVVSAKGATRLSQLKTLHLCNSIAFHPYGIRPEPTWPDEEWGFAYIGDVLNIYKEFAQETIDKQIEASEIGFNKSWFPDQEPMRAQAHSKMLLAMANLGMHRGAVFCLHDVMHNDFGLIDLLNNPLESYAAVFSAGPTIDIIDSPVLVVPPTIEYVQGRSIAQRGYVPKGGMLHGSRSANGGNSIDDEYRGTVTYVVNGTNGIVGWNVTVGNNVLCEHMDISEWGWAARAASRPYVHYEFAQPLESFDITDDQVRTMAWHWKHKVEARWPNVPRYFLTHAEAEVWGETGIRDGKTDPFSYNSPRAVDLKSRIMAALDVV